MVKFKEFIKEGTLEEFKKRGYRNTPPRAKFQIGDWVVVKGDQRWPSYQSQKTARYIGQYGKIVGYMPGSQYVKYAIEFPVNNNDVDGFHAHYIEGPYNGEAAAKNAALKNFDPNEKQHYNFSPTSNLEDIKGYVAGNFASNVELENFLKSVTSSDPFNLTWSNKQITFNDTKYIATVLAYRPFTSTSFKKGFKNFTVDTKIKNQKFYEFLGKNICLFRLNNIQTKKLVNINGRGLPDFDGWPGYSSSYALVMPRIDLERFKYGGKIIDFFNHDKILDLLNGQWVMTQEFVIFPKDIAKNANAYIPSLKSEFSNFFDIFEKKYNPQDLFNKFYEVKLINGKKYVNKDVTVDESTIKYFKDYHGDYQPNSFNSIDFTIVSSDPSKLKIPTGFNSISLFSPHSFNKGERNTIKNSAKDKLTDLTFIPPNVKDIGIHDFEVKSFEGLSDTMDGVAISHCQMDSLKTLPSEIGVLELNYNNMKDFSGGEHINVTIDLKAYFSGAKSYNGIPDAKNYRLEPPLDEKGARHEVLVRRMKSDTRKHFEDIFTGLDD